MAASLLDSPETHKRRSTQIKRVAGGIRTEIANGYSNGITPAETKTLFAAVTLLDKLAGNYDRAAAIAKKRVADRERREKLVLSAMRENFQALSSVEDRVAFLAAKNSTGIRGGRTSSLDDLAYWFNDEIKSLSYALSRKEGAPAELVAEVWAKYLAHRDDMVARHGDLIKRLKGI